MRLDKQTTLNEGIHRLQRRADTLQIALMVIKARARLHGDLELDNMIEGLMARLIEGDSVKQAWIDKLKEYEAVD